MHLLSPRCPMKALLPLPPACKAGALLIELIGLEIYRGNDRNRTGVTRVAAKCVAIPPRCQSCSGRTRTYNRDLNRVPRCHCATEQSYSIFYFLMTIAADQNAFSRFFTKTLHASRHSFCRYPELLLGLIKMMELKRSLMSAIST